MIFISRPPFEYVSTHSERYAAFFSPYIYFLSPRPCDFSPACIYIYHVQHTSPYIVLLCAEVKSSPLISMKYADPYATLGRCPLARICMNLCRAPEVVYVSRVDLRGRFYSLYEPFLPAAALKERQLDPRGSEDVSARSWKWKC